MNKFTKIYAILLSLLVPSLTAFAVGSSGFENATFSARSLAQANAVTAQADEPAAISYNPAGIVDLPGLQIQSSLAGINLFTHISSGSGNLKSDSSTAVIPTAYVTINPGKILDNRVAFGVGSDSPFGLSNKYESDHPATRYTGFRNELKMATIKPVVAVKVSDWLSLGAGPMYYNVMKIGAIKAYPNVLLGLGPLPDGQVRTDMNGTGWGWHAGMLVKPNEKHSLGFYFRSPVNVKLKGTTTVENATVGGNFTTTARSKLSLPFNMTWAYAYKPNEKTTIEADFGYTRWSVLDRIYTHSDFVNAGDSAILAAINEGAVNDNDYDNSFTFHLGGNRKVTDKLTILGGTAFYTKAIRNHHFTAAIPGGNSLIFSLGASYQATKNILLDLTYYGRWWLPRHVDNEISEVVGGNPDGKFYTYGQIYMASVTFMWDELFEKMSKKKDVEMAMGGTPGAES